MLEEAYKGYIIKVYQDEISGDGPRSCERGNFGIMICWHRRYDLGDKNVFKSPQHFEDFHANEPGIIALPLYLYDHGGLAMSTYSFVGRANHAKWDSGQIGWIYATRDMILKEFGGKNLSKKKIDRAVNRLREEVKTYDQYLRGEVYGYVIEDPDGEDIDSCWGFYGPPEDYMLLECRGIIDYEINRRREKEKKARAMQLKAWIRNRVLLQYRTPACY